MIVIVSSTLVNSQLVCLPPVGILRLVMFIYHYLFTLVLKSPIGEWPITYTFTILIISHNNTSDDRGLGTYKERDGQINPKDSWWYQNKNCRRSHSLERSTSYQVDFNLDLTLGPRMGPVITTYHSMK